MYDEQQFYGPGRITDPVANQPLTVPHTATAFVPTSGPHAPPLAVLFRVDGGGWFFPATMFPDNPDPALFRGFICTFSITAPLAPNGPGGPPSNHTVYLNVIDDLNAQSNDSKPFRRIN